MQRISLKTIEAQHDGNKITISYRAQIAEILRVPSDGRSADLDEVRRSIRILDELENQPGDVLNLEDADFTYLKQRVAAARWPIVNKVVLQFVEDVTNGG